MKQSVFAFATQKALTYEQVEHDVGYDDVK